MDNRICPECGTVNEPQYTYCKNCGTPLERGKGAEGTYGYSTGNQNFGCPPYGAPGSDNIDGVPTGDLMCFVGNNSYKIIDKWSVMQFTRRRTSWCWPAFLLSWFFGIAGAGYWFIYRRMYKLGAIILAISLLFGVAQVLSVSGSIINVIGDFSEVIAEIGETNGDVTDEWVDEQTNAISTSKDMMKIAASAQFFGALKTAFSVLAGLFSLYFYKNFAVSKIKGYGRPLSDTELSLAGGTSAGSAVLSVFLYGIAESFVMTVLLVVLFGAAFSVML